jgi:hypothetical protein
MRKGSETVLRLVVAAAVLSWMGMAAEGVAQQANDVQQTTDVQQASAQQGSPVANAGEVKADAQVAAGEKALDETAITPAQKDKASHVRIVRLSDVKGEVKLDRNTGHGLEATIANMPVVEGAKLQTADGAAEVEFEDGSALRVVPGSLVEFPQLELAPDGAKISTIAVKQGTVYVSLENTKGNSFVLKAGDATVSVMPNTHLRLDTDGKKTEVAVLKGDAQVVSGAVTSNVSKKQTLTIDPTAATQVTIAKNLKDGQFDAWDKSQDDYHKAYMARSSMYANSGGNFGVADLNYYGAFSNAGCGMMWQPYFVSAGWSPYANGMWAWYPNAGYSWVSPYPWGWLPYHTGSWSFCPGTGWGWMPGGNWNGLNNIAGIPGGAAYAPGSGTLRKGAAATGVAPVRPPAAPAATGSTLVVSNSQPLRVSGERTPGNFVFERDSAGLGVPRGSLGELKGLSHDVGQRGTANMEVHSFSMSQSADANGAQPRSNLNRGGQGQQGNVNAANGQEQHHGWHDNANAQNGANNNANASAHQGGWGSGNSNANAGAAHQGGWGSGNGGGNAGAAHQGGWGGGGGNGAGGGNGGGMHSGGAPPPPPSAPAPAPSSNARPAGGAR